MLILNPVYKELFRLGYKGRENTYMYWKRNEAEILRHLAMNRPDLIENHEVMRAFYAKLRWRSPIGMLLAFEISRVIPKLQSGLKTDLTDISVEYGKKPYSIGDFSKLHPVPHSGQVGCVNILPSKGTDLRGLSMYCLEFANLEFVGIDFSYAVINCSELERIRFTDCIMRKMEIRRSELVNSKFSKGCLMEEVNFTDTLVDAEFLCENTDPIITKLRRKDIRKILIGYNPRWRGFTEVRGDSFYKMSNNEKLKGYILSNQKTLNNIYETCENGIIERGLALVKTFAG